MDERSGDKAGGFHGFLLETVSAPRHDFFASIVVFLVALPLCIGIAVAVGVNPALALVTGIIGGLIVGFFSGSPLQVSGPAAGLFVILADLIESYKEQFREGEAATGLSGDALDQAALGHALVILGAAVILAGLIQIAAGRFGLGQWFRAVSPAVIKGMLAGIGVLIIVSQLHVMLDHEPTYHGKRAHGGLEYIATLPDAVWTMFAADEELHPPEESEAVAEENSAAAGTPPLHWKHRTAALVGIGAILIILLWQKFAPEGIRLLPGALIAVIVAAGASALAESVWGVNLHLLAAPRSLWSEMTFPSTATLTSYLDPDVIVFGLVIALVASAETLLCATAVDQMHDGARTNYDQELTAQGVGNLLCGLVGALPMTGVIVRSSANVQSGAKTRLATILHGLWLLIFVALLPFTLEYIPKAALGAMLVYTGFKLIDAEGVRELWNYGRSEVAIFGITLSLVVIEDLLVGVVVGIALSAGKLLYTFSHLEVDLKFEDGDGGFCEMKLRGAATFLRLPLLAQRLEMVPPAAELHVDMSELDYIDHACLDLLISWAEQHAGTGGRLVIDWDSLHAKFRSDKPDDTPPDPEAPARE